MSQKTYAEAIREALREEMRRDDRVFLMGEDVGLYGGAFGVSTGLIDEFGPDRVQDTPISESAIIGAAAGAAVTGMRPVAEIMFIDFLAMAGDQLVNQAAKMRYMFGGASAVPMVVRTQGGAGRSAAAQHSQSLEAWYVHVPGLLVVMPSTPYDAKGLLKSAIRDDNPVLFIENKMLYSLKGPVPDEEYLVPLGKADIKRKGFDVTVVATSRMVHFTLEAAEEAARVGIDVEVVDPRTLKPLDKETIVDSVKKTGRLVVVHDACKTGGFGAEVAATIVESDAFDYLDAPVERVCGLDVPAPYSPALEPLVLPSKERILLAVQRTLR